MSTRRPGLVSRAAARAPAIVRAAQAAAALPKSIQRSFGEAVIPSPDQRAGSYITKTFTYRTVAGGDIKTLYTADIQWAKVKLFLETAGPVAVSTSQFFLPVLSGKGILLPTGDEVDITLARGNRLYIASPTVNRVRVIVEPIPWLEQLLGGVVRGFDLLFKTVRPSP